MALFNGGACFLLCRIIAVANDSSKHNPPVANVARGKRRLPILARHAVSLAVVFAVALPLSYFVGSRFHRAMKLDKLTHEDREVFDEGLAYVYQHAADSPAVLSFSLEQTTILDAERGADLLASAGQSYAQAVLAPPNPVIEAAGPLFERLSAPQAIGLYDTLSSVPGIDPGSLGDTLLEQMVLPEDDAMFAVVELLQTRLLWSKEQVPTNKWLDWLAMLSMSESQLTQHQAAKLLGEMPDAADDPRIQDALARLSNSPHQAVRVAALNACAGYAAIAEDPTAYEQVIFELGNDPNKAIARRAWLIVGHLTPLSGYAVNWKNADPFVAEAMLWASVKTNPQNPKPAIDALSTKGFEAAGALALNEWRRPVIPVSISDLILQKLIESHSERDIKVAWRSILSSKDYINAETSAIWPYGYKSNDDAGLAPLYLAGNWIRAGDAPVYNPDKPFSEFELLAYLEGVIDHGGNGSDAKDPLIVSTQWPPLVRTVAAAHGVPGIDLDKLVGEFPLNHPSFLNIFSLALSHSDDATIDRFIRSSNPEMIEMASLACAIAGRSPSLLRGGSANLTDDQLRVMTDAELSEVGVVRVDAITALLDAAEAAPPSAGRQGEAKLLRLALWMRGDLGDDFTATAEGMLFDADLPTSTVLLALLHMQRPIALEYLFGDLVNPQPDLHELFIQQRYWHVFRRFVDTPDLTLWLWGDPDAQAFQLEAMRQWYAVNRWKIEAGWWPAPTSASTK